MKEYDIIAIGGGAVGYFSCINALEQQSNLSALIIEQGKEVLNKVRISGGGRCNVTHACFDPRELVEYYPRGKKELLGPFNYFACGDTVDWYDQHGVELKIESDGRMFPVSNSSKSIIDCLESAAEKQKIAVKKSCRVESIQEKNGRWILETNSSGSFSAKHLIIAAGSSKSIWNQLEGLGHSIIETCPSLFTFNIKDNLLKELPGISFPNVELSVNEVPESTIGPLLITHWGLSGPAVLKMSAFGARILAKSNYNFELNCDFLPNFSQEQLTAHFLTLRTDSAQKLISGRPQFEFTKRFWQRLLEQIDIKSKEKWGDISNQQIQSFVDLLKRKKFEVKGKSTFKEEFVTAGGVDLNEINFKTFESKLFPNLFMAGEIINVDALTGGFNFQAAWTGAWIIAQTIIKKIKS